MCFNARFLLKMALKRAQHNHSKDAAYWESLLIQWDEWFLVSGFAHPRVVVYSNLEPFEPEQHTWGLVPGWAKTKESIWNNTLNAKSETMFEKPAFRKAAETQRCIIPAAGFYEYHHFRNKAYPFYIYPKAQDQPFYFAGLWDEWVNRDNGEKLKTFSIVTTRANGLMAHIHNKPQYDDKPRMPVILPEALTDEYLKPLSRKQVEELCEPYPETLMEAHTVRSISGKNSPGNVPGANDRFEYSELEFGGKDDQLKLF